MKHNKLQLKAALLLLLSGLTLTAQATVTGSYNSTTKTLSFTGSGEVTQAIVQATSDNYKDATSVSFGSGVTSIGESAFYYVNLTSVTIPSTITEIGMYAFQNCRYLKKITFASGTTELTVNNQAFRGAGSSNINSGGMEFDCYRPFAYSKTQGSEECNRGIFSGSCGLAKVVIGANVTSIPDHSFYNAIVNSIDLSGATSLRSIGIDAFALNNISSISIPQSVTFIAKQAFFKCNPSKITFESGTTTLQVADDAFDEYEASETVIGDSPDYEFDCYRNFECASAVTTSVFLNDEDLTKVVIGANVTAIPRASFSGCVNLTTLDLDDASDLTTIEEAAFYNCGMTQVVISGFVSRIKSQAFYSSKLQKAYISVPDCDIDDDAFAETTELIYCDTYEELVNNYKGKESKVTQLFISSDNIANYSGYTTSSNLGSMFPNLTKVTFGSSVTTIGANIFYGCTHLTTIVIGNGVTSLASSAFVGCTNLTDLTIKSATIANPSTAYTNTNNLADRFPKLKTLTFGSGVTTVGAKCFYVADTEDYPLTTVTLTEETAIGNGAFYCNESLSAINGKVKSVDCYAFYGTNINKINITGSNAIGSSAFYNCRSLSSVTIPSNVTAIATEAFRGCTSLESITLPSALTGIYSYAFYGCTKLNNVVIPEKVTTIDEKSFGGCTALKTLTINSATIASKTYTADANLTDQFLYITNLTFGANVTVVGDYCFNYDGTGTYPLASVTFASTSAIGQYAFANNRLLSSISESVKKVAASSFANCEMLKSISITDDALLEQYAFKNCTALENVTLPSNLTSINACAFYNCSALSSITLPSTLTTIYGQAFYNCTSLNNVVIPESVTTISKTAFGGCSKLTDVRINSATIANPTTNTYTADDNLADRFPYLQNLTYGANVTDVYDNSFSVGLNESYPLTTVTFNSEPNIGIGAFLRDKALTTINGKVKSVDISSFQWTSIGSISITGSDAIGITAFSYCKSLTSVTMPSTVTTINKEAFMYCTALESITLPTSLTSLEESTFKGCTSLNNVVIPSNITSINSTAFSECTALTDVTINSNALTSATYTAESTLADLFSDNLQSVVIGDAVTTIGAYAFYESGNLCSITIGKNVTSLASTAFQKCDSWITKLDIESNAVASIDFPDGQWTMFDYFSQADISDLVFGSEVTKIGEFAFDGSWNQCDVINVTFKGNPDIGEVAFRGASVENVTGTVKNVGDNAFEDCCISKIEIKGATTIGDEAFSDAGLSAITIGDGVTTIGEAAFVKCNFSSIKLPSSVTSIGAQAFSGCSYLRTIEIPEKVTSIASYLFYGCNLLNNVVIPANITSMYSNAFNSCKALTNLTINSDAVANPSTAYTTTDNLRTRFPYVKNLTFGDDITTIGENAMTNSTTLQSLVIGSGVKSLATTAFSGCTALTKLDIESNTIARTTYTSTENLATRFPYLTDLTLGEKVTYVGNYCFYAAKAGYPLSSIICKGTPGIGVMAFSLNKNLTTITGAVKDVESFSFQTCEKLTSITITNDGRIDAYAFSNCSALESVTLPSNLTEISHDAFFYCTKLNNVVIPAGVTSIGDKAFYYCTGLKQLTCLNLTPVTLTTDQNVFFGVKNCELDVPYTSMDTYKAAEVWKDFYEYFASEGLKLVDGEEYTMTKEDLRKHVYPIVRYTRTFSTAGKWNALYLPFSFDVTKYADKFDIAEIWTVCPTSDTDGDGDIDTEDDCKMVVNILKSGSTTANKPCLIRPKEAGTIRIEEDDPGLAIAEENSVKCSTTHNEYVIKGLYSPLAIEADDGNYYMSVYGNLSYMTSGTATIKPNRWVMTINDKNDYSENITTQAKFNVIVLGEDLDEATAIKYINGDIDSVNANDDAIYNLNGVKMNNTENLPRGIYIKNGKKVIIK